VDVSRLFSQQNETQRLFQSAVDTLYDYAVQRATSSTRLGGIAGLSYRLSPGSTVHVRGFYTNVADNEVRTYQGPDHNRDEPITGGWLVPQVIAAHVRAAHGGSGHRRRAAPARAQARPRLEGDALGCAPPAARSPWR
jgi:hypothetical protein